MDSAFSFNRLLKLPIPFKKSLFLWGPRQTGKTSLLRKAYPDLPTIQLLKSEEFADYSARPQLLRERVKQWKTKQVVIDEIQRVPDLLNEVQYLIEEEKVAFVLCGSSARKLKKHHANLLGGRAIRLELFGLTAYEMGDRFDLNRVLNRGALPAIYLADSDLEARQLLRSYCADYLKEEIFSEGLVRQLPPFSRFLEAAAIGDTEILSFESFARDCGVSAPTIQSYFNILHDTLLGAFLPGYSFRPKRKIISSPKFYFFDVGIVAYLAQRGEVKTGSELWGKALENWVHQELRSYLSYRQRPETMSYWRLTTQVEVDFIVGKMKCAIEVKSSPRIHADHLKGLREIKVDHPDIGRRIVVSGERHSRQTDDGIEVLTVEDFLEQLWSDQLF